MRLIDALFDPIMRRSRRNEESFVREPAFARRLMLREGLLFVVVLAATWRDDTSSMLGIAASLLVGLFVGWGALSGVRRAMSYRSGWLSGRAAMVDALRESMHRQMTLEDWLDGELARDYAVMGIDVRRPSDESDE